jgi:hypothetical protein
MECIDENYGAKYLLTMIKHKVDQGITHDDLGYKNVIAEWT